MAYDMNQTEILEATARVTPQWLAGFFDGEGYVAAQKGANAASYSVRVFLYQKEPKVLALVQFLYGGNSSYRVRRGRKQGCHELHWYGKAALPLLRVIKDHVICKRRQVEAGIEMAEQQTYTGSPYSISTENIVRREELARVIISANQEI